MSRQRRYTFVIPARNEQARLARTLDAIVAFLRSQSASWEIIVVDDGSTDQTAEVALAFRENTPGVRLLRLDRRRGKGFAIRRGVIAARGEIIVLCDADLHQSITELRKLEVALRRGADVAIGSRWLGHYDCVRSQPLHRRAGGRIFNLLARRLLGLRFKDTQCGLKAFTRRAALRVFPRLTIAGWGYDIEFLYLALRSRLRVQEISLRILHDYSESRFRTFSDGCRTLWELLQIRWRERRGFYGRPTGPSRPVTIQAMTEPTSEAAA